jgi:hypothetical protein
MAKGFILPLPKNKKRKGCAGPDSFIENVKPRKQCPKPINVMLNVSIQHSMYMLQWVGDKAWNE